MTDLRLIVVVVTTAAMSYSLRMLWGAEQRL